MCLKSLLTLSLILVGFNALGSVKSPDVVYGEDNRHEPYERPLWWYHSRSVAAQVEKKHFNIQSLLGYTIRSNTHAVDYALCSGERFANQPVIARCSGSLVGYDVILTAGHCVTNQEDCNNFNWVFGYEMDATAGNPTVMQKKDVYTCKSVLATSFGPGKSDFALIKLDRPVNRRPLQLLPSGQMAKVGDDIVMMGYPSGLPLKITDGAQIQSTQNNVHVTNLDAFHVNSGSPVFDEKSGLIVGILVAGEPDYRPSGRGCQVVNVLDHNSGRERVTPVNFVPRR